MSIPLCKCEMEHIPYTERQAELADKVLSLKPIAKECDTEASLADEWRDAEFAADESEQNLIKSKKLVDECLVLLKAEQEKNPSNPDKVESCTKDFKLAKDKDVEARTKHQLALEKAKVAKRNWDDFVDPSIRDEFRKRVRALGGETVAFPKLSRAELYEILGHSPTPSDVEAEDFVDVLKYSPRSPSYSPMPCSSKTNTDE